MKNIFSIRNIAVLLIGLVVIFASCSKRRELKQLGCVKGKSRFGEPYHYVGPMTKKVFFTYLDSPSFYYNGELISVDMRWTKIKDPEECPIGK